MTAYGARPHWLGEWRSIKLGVLVATVICVGLSPLTAFAEWHSLTGTLPAHTGNVNYIISPDSRMVAFAADIDSDDVDELYAVPITGTTPIKLNPPLVESGDVEKSRIAFTPDSQSVIYLADQEVDNRVEMFSVPAGGGQAAKLNPPLVAGGNVLQFKIDAKNGRIVYLADQETNEVLELWSVPIGGGTAVKLNSAFVTGGNIDSFQIDPLSNRVVYSADAETDRKYELYSVPVAGGTAIKLNPPIVLTGGGDSGICCGDYAVNPIIPVVVFIARQSDAQRGRLYMIPTAGGDLTQLSFEMLLTQRILSFRISPAGDRVVFNVGTRDGSTNAFKGNLYSNLIGATGAADITEKADPLFGTDTYRILPDGSRVVYSFQNNAAAPARLESATLLGERAPLYVPGASDPSLYNFDFSPDSDWVMFQTSTGGTEQNIRTIPPTGGGSTGHGSGRYHLITPDSSRIAYSRIVDAQGHSDLFSAQIFGGDERNLSGLNGAGFVFDVRASPDGAWIAFNTQIDGHYDLRVSDGTEAQPPITALAAANDGPKEVGVPITLTATITGGTEISYTWDFGDGGTGSGITTTHAYVEAGVYTATVQVVSSANSMTATTTVYVGDAVVAVSDNKYTPQDVTIPPGGTVVWVLKEGFHSVTADDGSFEQPAGNDWPPFVHVFAGAASPHATTVSYHCSVHGFSMSGTVTIVEGQFKVMLPIVRGD